MPATTKNAMPASTPWNAKAMVSVM